ncbi:hypothetical protein OPT61_g826 [Boeremia exigua]|uniref:Uncharacterized protein n=1 Tax=Boeremia exigua TaxID=749465 RepID=A0ACC2ISQ4_9PLEO|nr:hypothetical protein OPT61_g826 [Boeremia exigua]
MSLGNGVIGIGGSAIVYAYDETTVLKGYAVAHAGRVFNSRSDVEYSRRCLTVEYQVYQRLGEHKNIPKCYGWVVLGPEAKSLRLKWASKGNLRTFIETNDSAQTPTSVRLAWAMDLAEGLAHLHSKRVYHCDLSCRNILLTGQNVVQICDFGGSGLDSDESEGVEEPRYELPLRGRTWEERPYRVRDLFALGSALYEIMAWQKPFAQLEDDEVQKRFEREEFPDTSGIACNEVIQNCWNERYETAEETLFALQAVVEKHKSAKPL